MAKTKVIKKPVKKVTKPVAKAKPIKKAATPVKKTKPVAKPTVVKSAAKKPVPKKTVASKPAAKPVKKTAVKTTQSKPAVKAVPTVTLSTVTSKKAAPSVNKPTTAKTTALPPVKTEAVKSQDLPVSSSKTEIVKGAVAKAAKPNIKKLEPRKVELVAARVELPSNYKPSMKEEYMSANHLEYFRQKLVNWRADLVEESKQTIENLRDEVRDVGDEAERATRETENSLELRTRDRYRKLISKIDKALKRIEDGSYGFCEETGEEIGLERLEARPIATLSLDAQERWEHRQKQMGD